MDEAAIRAQNKLDSDLMRESAQKGEFSIAEAKEFFRKAQERQDALINARGGSGGVTSHAAAVNMSGGPPAWLWVAGGTVGAFGLGALLYLLFRRKR